jgi:phenylalanyl-tRNA synthetase beta chain
MKFSENWLREWVDPAFDTQALGRQLTMSGLEVESITAAAKPMQGVVVAEVRAVQPHPDAERLRVCSVFDGSHEFQVVCGAPNVRVGLRVPLAREGAQLPGLTIKRATLRGVESCGMLCSADELGMDARGDGLLELPGSAELGCDIVALLDLDDQIIELGLTPNRGDCLGMAGLAREVAALNGLELERAPFARVAAVIPDRLEVTLAAPAACPRYAGRVIRGVNPAAETPLWMQERLRRAGVRSIAPVVDVSNYVLLELGQPMHAFDLGKLQGPIVVRMAHPGERLALLDNSVVELRVDTLVIADQGGPIALAGIMGGLDSAVGEQTRDIFLESAFFMPATMAGRARGYGMHTDASHRYERGVDFELQLAAIERATELLLATVGGKPGPVVLASADEHLPELAPIQLRAERLAMMLGVSVPAGEVEDILRRLGLGVERAGSDWQVTPPSFRFDLRIEADLIEEVARVHGYHRIPARVQTAAMPMRVLPEARHTLGELRHRLIAMGYQEAITFSFVEPRLQAMLDPGRSPVPVTNPISAEMAVMRTTLWAGLIKAAQFNQNRQQRSMRLFETGLRFLPGPDGLEQRVTLAGIVTGERSPENWASVAGDFDFYDIKGDVEALLDVSETSAEFRFEPASHAALHPGQCAVLRRSGVEVGHLGALHPELLESLELHGPVFLFELDFEILGKKNLPSFKGLSRFPEVRRDIAVVVEEKISAAQLLDVARAAAGDWLTQLKLFDIYRGQGIDPDKKSVAIGVVLQHMERTLTDEEVNAVIDRMVAGLTRDCGAALRY